MTTAATSRSPATAGKADAGTPKPKRSRKKKLILLAVVVIVLGVVGYVGQALLLGGDPPKAAPDPKTVAGKVLALNPITMNLADGHFLKLTFVLQLSKAGTPTAGAEGADTATPALNNAAALDASIDVLGEHTYAQLIAPGGRARAQKELLVEIQKRYPGEVLGLYFTEFLMQ
jgi:flagellar protein FliL